MDLTKLQRAVIDALEDVKAQDIRVFDTGAQTSEFERVIIASGTSNRQARALASSVHDKIRAMRQPVLSIEGQDTGEWVLVDLGPIIVHIMQPAIRQYYNLEEIWGRKPVRVKLGGTTTKLATASTQDADDDTQDEGEEQDADTSPRAARKAPTGRGASTAPVTAGRAPRKTKLSTHELAPAHAPIDTSPLGYEDDTGDDGAYADHGGSEQVKRPRGPISASRAPRPSTRSGSGARTAKPAAKPAAKTAAKPATARTAAKTPSRGSTGGSAGGAAAKPTRSAARSTTSTSRTGALAGSRAATTGVRRKTGSGSSGSNS